MTGGGFGGCIVAVVRTDAVARVSAALREQYVAKTGVEATVIVSRPAQGAVSGLVQRLREAAPAAPAADASAAAGASRARWPPARAVAAVAAIAAVAVAVLAWRARQARQ